MVAAKVPDKESPSIHVSAVPRGQQAITASIKAIAQGFQSLSIPQLIGLRRTQLPSRAL